jgi:hypothetical protein
MFRKRQVVEEKREAEIGNKDISQQDFPLRYNDI